MAISDNKTLYFDRVARTKKMQTVNALSNVTYYCNGNKKEIIDNLGIYLDKLRDGGKGSYGKSNNDIKNQFQSQYTPGLEFGVWKFIDRKEMILTDLARKMAVGEITPQYYMSNVLRNYYQIIDNKVVNPLYSALMYMKRTSKFNLYREDINRIKDFNLDSEERDNRNVLHHILGDTLFFEKCNEKERIIWNSELFSIDEVIDMCDTSLLKMDVDFVRDKYSDQTIYAKFITKE